MTYYTFHIDDSGAIEEVDEIVINGETTLICKMYDDDDFNKLNDILHSVYDYILKQNALEIFQGSKTIPFEVRNAKVLRKEKTFGFFKMNKSYDYYQIRFLEDTVNECYNWIDFDNSQVIAIDSYNNKKKVQSHQQTLDMIKENKSDSDLRYSFEANKIVFGHNFDPEIDLFKIPLYSWGVYVSERLKNKLEEARIRDIGFAVSKEELGKVWKPHFPVIEFKK